MSVDPEVERMLDEWRRRHDRRVLKIMLINMVLGGVAGWLMVQFILHFST